MKSTTTAHPPSCYLGLELSGAKNQKTAIAALHYYPRENKIFLLDVHDGIGPLRGKRKGLNSSDEILLEALREFGPKLEKSVAKMGVNVPLTLPPCLECTRPACTKRDECADPSLKWVAEFLKKNDHDFEFTPYTQRPVEVWLKNELLPMLDPKLRFEIDEAMGGNRAPLTARMHFLKKRLGKVPIVEVLPKLSLATLAKRLSLPTRTIQAHRKIEEGAAARALILERMSDTLGLFIYDRDTQKLARSLAAFDAFICALTALLSDQNRCAKIPKGFPVNSGWIAIPI